MPNNYYPGADDELDELLALDARELFEDIPDDIDYLEDFDDQNRFQDDDFEQYNQNEADDYREGLDTMEMDDMAGSIMPGDWEGEE